MSNELDGFRAERVVLSAGPINYREAGEGSAIVFVHGALMNGKLWEETASALAAGHRCIVPEWPLGSHTEAMAPNADLSPRGLASLVSEFVATLDLDDVTIVGNDSGGAISQILVTEFPERIGRLVLTNCDCFEKFPPAQFKAMTVAARFPIVYGAMIQPMRLASMRRSSLGYGDLTEKDLDDELMRGFAEPSLTDGDIRRDGRRFVAAMDTKYTMAAAAKFPQVKIPVLLAWGTADPFFTVGDAQRIAELIPDCTLVEIPGAGTFTAFDKPLEIAREVEKFLAGSRSPVSGA